MIQLAKLQFNHYGVNTYLLICADTKETIIVDCATSNSAEFAALVNYIEKNELKPIMVASTHGHVDHICGASDACEHFSVPYAMSSADQGLLDVALDYGPSMGFAISSVPTIAIDLSGVQEIKLGENSVEVIKTPGHSLGGVCFHIPSQKLLITGDTLFAGSIGRTDLPGGDYDQLMRSIVENLIPLDGATKVFPGHGGESTLSHEAMYNPFVSEVLQGGFNTVKE